MPDRPATRRPDDRQDRQDRQPGVADDASAPVPPITPLVAPSASNPVAPPATDPVAPLTEDPVAPPISPITALPRGAWIRPARSGDVQAMRAIERGAGEAFRAIGMDDIADDEPLRPSQLRAYAADGRAWVAELDGRTAAYLIARVVDGCGHVDQVSVDPSFGGLRLGAALIDTAGEWAREQGLPALTLTTFRDVPWNAPYYERLGFRLLADDDAGPGLRSLREAEVAHGLDRRPRCCMRREIVGARG